MMSAMVLVGRSMGNDGGGPYFPDPLVMQKIGERGDGQFDDPDALLDGPR